jgi:cardiolipin synthase (CMP-forming)
MEGWLTPPNALTLGRMAATPWIGFLLARGRYQEALPVLFVVGMTDAFDGWLARRFGWQSKLGGYLDPIADKFLLTVVYISFLLSGAVPGWLAVLVLARDACILLFAAGAYAFAGIRSFAPSVWGKLSTCLQLLLAGGTVWRGWAPGVLPEWLMIALLWGTAGATVWSGVHYLSSGLGMLRRQRHGKAPD